LNFLNLFIIIRVVLDFFRPFVFVIFLNQMS
jgi:hypothetical protein